MYLYMFFIFRKFHDIMFYTLIDIPHKHHCIKDLGHRYVAEIQHFCAKSKGTDNF